MDLKAPFFLLAALAPVAGASAPGSIKLDNYTIDKAVAIPGRSWLVKFDKSYAYGDKENDDLREKFKISKDDFPAYFLFTDADRAGKKYTGAITAHDLAIWLRQNGIKMPAIGTIYEMDQIATRFMKEGGTSDADIAELKKLAEGEFKTDKKSEIYVKIAGKVKEQGVSYVEKERERVDKIMKGKLTPERETR